MKWSLEAVREEGLKYNTKTEFKANAGGAYTTMCKYYREYLDEICSHMVTPPSSRVKWTLKTLRQEALKYKNRKEFNTHSNGAYQTMHKKYKEHVDEICSHMRRPSNYLLNCFKWTLDEIKKEALKYKNRKEFGTKSKSMYAAMHKHYKIHVDEICSHMTKPKSKLKWTLEAVREEALKYNSRLEFNTNASGAYNAMHVRYKEHVDEICSHMEYIPGRWKRYIYAIEFSDTNSVYIGLSYDPDKRLTQHIGSTSGTTTVQDYMDSVDDNYNLKYLINEPVDEDVASQLEEEFRQIYKKNEWNILNKIMCGGIGHGGSHVFWTLDVIREEALKYNSRSEFINNASGAYDALCRKHPEHKDEICSHMVRPAMPRIWTLDLIEEEALKYETRNEFRVGAPGAYSAMRKHYITHVDEIYSHMIRPDIKWTLEVIREEALKYKSRDEFMKNGRGAYNAMHKHYKIHVDEICSHMIPKLKWTLDAIREEALKYKTRKEFNTNASGAYDALHTRHRDQIDEICSHMESRVWTLEPIRKEALKYNTRSEFRSGSSGAYYALLKNNRHYLDDVCSHMTPRFMWTLETIREEALKYNTRSEFQKGSGAFCAMYRRYTDHIDEICSHMKEKQHPKWTLEAIKKEALKYNTKTEFKKESGGACSSLYKKYREYVDEICSHM